MEHWLQSLDDDPPVAYWIHVKEESSFSESIAKKTGVDHQSPQVLFLFDEEATWHASTYSVTEYDLDRGYQHLRNDLQETGEME